jgi:hypothetical protein
MREAMMLVNESAADTVVANIQDSVVRNLVLFGIAEARRRFMREAGATGDLTNLPAEPFDLGFFASVLVSLFEKRDIVQKVLAGEDLAKASGWNV